MKKFCETCLTEFKIKQKNQRFCSLRCQREAYYKTHPTYSYGENLSKHTKGAITELMVANDLMLKGYEVFRSLSAQCSCDLIIKRRKSNVTKTIEVKTGLYSERDRSKMNFIKNKYEADIFAVVTHEDKKIHYMDLKGNEIDPERSRPSEEVLL